MTADPLGASGFSVAQFRGVTCEWWRSGSSLRVGVGALGMSHKSNGCSIYENVEKSLDILRLWCL